MSGSDLLRRLPASARASLIASIVLLLAAFGAGSWLLGLAAVCALGVFARATYEARSPRDLEPWVWPEDFRSTAEQMTRPIIPTRDRVYLPDTGRGELAEIVTSPDELQRILTEKPPLWRWSAFTSILLQRRNSVQPRLRTCALGYQPGSGIPIDGPMYSQLAWTAMHDIADLVRQLEQFMLSPAFTGVFGPTTDEQTIDAESIAHIASRLMDYHGDLLTKAELCLQTPVATDVIVFAQDTGAFAMCPLVGYDQFITTMCDRVAQAQDLLPFADGPMSLDHVSLTIDLPDGLIDQIVLHINRFNR